MLEREEKIEMIVHHEVDRMNIHALRSYAEEHMTEELDHMLSEEIEDIFLEVMDGKLV
jgi:hypothetical protein